FYGRTARIFYVGAIRPEQARVLSNYLAVAAGGSGPAHDADDLRAILRHPRVHAAAALWRNGLRVRRGALPHRVPHPARTRPSWNSGSARCEALKRQGARCQAGRTLSARRQCSGPVRPRESRDWLIGELTDVREPVDLVGHDWGGGHVVNVAMSRPDLIRSWASDVVGIFDPGTAIRRPRRGAGRGTCRAGNER